MSILYRGLLHINFKAFNDIVGTNAGNIFFLPRQTNLNPW